MSESAQFLVDQFLDSNKDELEQKTEELLRSLISLEIEKKEIDGQMKILKDEAKADGVDIAKLTKVYNRLKARLKTKDEDLFIEDKMEENILNNQELVDEIVRLIKPLPAQHIY